MKKDYLIAIVGGSFFAGLLCYAGLHQNDDYDKQLQRKIAEDFLYGPLGQGQLDMDALRELEELESDLIKRLSK